MPTPNSGEARNHFVSRCIPIVLHDGTAANNDQAVAICENIWERHHGKETGMNRQPTFKLLLPENAIKGTNDTTRTLQHAISVLMVDRDGDVVIPKGGDFENYRKNPVVFLNHKSWSDAPIGRCLDLDADDSTVMAVTQFAGDAQAHPQAETVYRLYRDGFMKAWSMGFRVTQDSRQPVMQLQTGRTILGWELLEYSAVGIPANPDAVMRMCRAAGLPKGATEKDLAKAVGKLPVQKFWDMALPILGGTDEEETKMVPSDVSEKKAPKGTAWSAPGLKDFTDKSWDDLTDAEKRHIAGHYAWADEMPPKSFGDLKLPHHRASDGAVVFRGVVAAAGRLNQTDGIDEAAVKAHLAKHYHQFDEKAPWEKEASVEPSTTKTDDEKMPLRVGKSINGYECAGYTAPAVGKAATAHVHDYRLSVVDEDGAENGVVFRGGWAYPVADHSHRITMASLVRGETEEADGHTHKLMSSADMQQVLTSFANMAAKVLSLTGEDVMVVVLPAEAPAEAIKRAQDLFAGLKTAGKVVLVKAGDAEFELGVRGQDGKVTIIGKAGAAISASNIAKLSGLAGRMQAHVKDMGDSYTMLDSFIKANSKVKPSDGDQDDDDDDQPDVQMDSAPKPNDNSGALDDMSNGRRPGKGFMDDLRTALRSDSK